MDEVVARKFELFRRRFAACQIECQATGTEGFVLVTDLSMQRLKFFIFAIGDWAHGNPNLLWDTPRTQH